MDKIAILSDIHGNIPAFEAVLEDIHRRRITTIYCLGDLVGKGPSSDVAVDLVREHCERIVKGNWDDFITKEDEHANEMIHWHQNRLGAARLQYLRTLPFAIEFWMSGRYVRLFHASPRSCYERIQPWDSIEQRLSMFESSEHCVSDRMADIAGYGDIHHVYMRHLKNKMLFNVGSVGNPLDIPQASYAILEGEYGSETSATLNIQFIRVPYDIELAIRQAEDADMPDLAPYIQELRTAKYRGIKS